VLGHSLVLETTTNIPLSNIEWTPSWDLDCSYCLSPTATPTEDQTYVITAETEAGCFDMDSITVRLDRDPVIYIPNIFSPNNDQVNDFFEIRADALNVKTIDQAIIFDRWGGIMSEKGVLFNEGRMILWDGMTPSGPVNSGLYVYIIKYTTVDGIQRTSLGDVTVVR
jgi:gliding motility-associated-like protein